MLGKIIIGIFIGFLSGLFTSKFKEGSDSYNLILVFLIIVSVAFIGSSFMYGAIFGVMAIGEIAIGYTVANTIFVNHNDQ